MKSQNFKRTKFACYAAYFTMSSIFSLPPLLFATLQDMYGISYTLLGTLVLTNFCTQLTVDLIFTFFTKYFNIKKTVRIMPLITSAGMLIYAFIPMFLPQYAYAGLLVGTVLFSISAGLSEVLLSPVIAAIPSDNPQKDMSLLHSLYAFGVFTVLCIRTVQNRASAIVPFSGTGLCIDHIGCVFRFLKSIGKLTETNLISFSVRSP